MASEEQFEFRRAEASGAAPAAEPAAAPGGFDDLTEATLAAVARMRQATSVLVLPAPQHLPAGLPTTPAGTEGATTVLKVLAASAMLAVRHHDWPTALALARGAALHLPQAAGAAVPWPPARGVSAVHDAYDSCYRLARAPQGDSSAFVRALVSALAVFIDEAEGLDSLSAYAPVGQALVGLWAGALGVDARHGAAVLQPPVAGEGAASGGLRRPLPPRSPIRRWLRGHQVHAVLQQGLCWTLQRLPADLVDADDARIAVALRRLTRLFDAAATNLVFTFDCDGHAPARSVVQAQEAIRQQAGGRHLLSHDERRLQGLWSVRQSALRRAEERCPSEYAEMQQAQARSADLNRRCHPQPL